MKRIITAMGNATLNNELKRYEEYDLNESDLYYQDAVIDAISSEKYDVLVVSALLQGQLEFIDFINKIRKIDRVMRIIIVTDEITSDVKRSLKEYGIIDIFLDDEIEVSDIIDAINREEPLRKKYETVKEEKKKYISEIQTHKEIEEKVVIKPINNIIQKQEIIAVSGINGAGKSTIVANFAKVLSSKTSSKVLIIDMDTLNGNIDEILEINKVPQNVEIIIDENKKCGLNYAAELISKNRFDVNVFDELVINTGNIDILTGNTSLHYCQNVLCEEHYNKILECAKDRYDFIIIDSSSNIFLDSTKWVLQQANRIFFVVENDYISMKKATQLINVITDIWGVWKNKIEIVINKEKQKGIESEVVQKILKDYEVIGKIKQGEENLEISYSRILETINYIPKTNILSRLFTNKYQEIFSSNRIPMQKLNKKEGAIINVN